MYQRSEEVEQQIQFLANLPDNEILARIRNQAQNSPEYVQDESLVYWVREYLHLGDSQRAGVLAEALLSRCVRRIQSKLRNLGPDLAPQAEQDVVSQLFSDIFDIESDRSDFMQVRFGLTLDRRIIGAFKQYVRVVSQTEAFLEEESEVYDDDYPARDMDSPDPLMAGLSTEDRVLVRDGLATIPEPLREAFILRHFCGWQIESKEPGVPNLSGYFKKEPRTIRNWLNRAEDVLREWRNEERS